MSVKVVIVTMYMRHGKNKTWYPEGMTTHGMSGTPEYRAYISAKKRCNNPNSEGYPNYGARGIEFRFSSFEEFFEEVGERPDNGHSLDRIDTNGHYEPGNIRWELLSTQNNNCRRRRTKDLATQDPLRDDFGPQSKFWRKPDWMPTTIEDLIEAEDLGLDIRRPQP